MNSEQRMIDKIKKLFALAANESSQGNESANAMRMANALLKKHAIEKHQLHQDDAVFASFMDYPISQIWVKSLVGTIARFYNCRAIFDYNWDKPKSLIIGTLGNRTTATIVIEQLMSQIIKETKGKDAMFRNGAICGLSEKCKEILAEKDPHDEIIPGTGITVVAIDKQQKAASDDFISANFSHLKKSKGGRASSEGAAYGSGLNPNARINGSAQKCLN